MMKGKKPEACKGCPAYDWGVGFVPPTGRTPCNAYIVGQGPGEQEAYYSKPFYEKAPSGRMLDRWLNRSGYSRHQLRIGNVVQCWLPAGKRGTKAVPHGNRAPKTEEMEYCYKTHVLPDILACKPTHILAVGSSSASFLMGLSKTEPVDKYLGTFNHLALPVPQGDEDGRQDSTEEAGGEGGRASAEAGVGSAGESRQGDAVRHDEEGHEGGDAGSAGPECGPRSGRDEAVARISLVDAIKLSEVREAPREPEAEPVMSVLSRSRSAGSDDPVIVPLLHPSAVLRGRWEQEPAQKTFLKRALDEALRGAYRERFDVMDVPPNTDIYPSLDRIDEFVDGLLERGNMFSMDIESAGEFIICIGFSEICRESLKVLDTIVVRFKGQGGRNWYDKIDDHKRALLAVQRLLESNLVKVFQNGVTFDVPELQALGITINPPFLDTMHMAHTAYPEASKGLQYLATLHLSMPVWKSLTDDDEIEGKG